MRGKQSFERVFGFKSDTAVLMFTFRFLSSPLFLAFLASFLLLLLGIQQPSFLCEKFLRGLLGSQDQMKGKASGQLNKIFIENQCYMLGCVQTDATTLNIVAPTMLGVVACVLTVVYKRMQQLPTMLGPAVHHGKDTTHKSL